MRSLGLYLSFFIAGDLSPLPTVFDTPYCSFASEFPLKVGLTISSLPMGSKPLWGSWAFQLEGLAKASR